jgi:flagellar hook-associated protein 3 FlgL
MIYDAGVAAINRQTADLLHLNQQVSTGRRIVTPSDDPVAAARALEVQQAKDVTAQYSTNQDNAKSALGLEEAQLTSVTDMFGRLRELTVQAGNDPLTANDRKSVALELRARFDELMGIANSTDGAGQYLFSGYQGATKPFGGNVDALVAGTATEVSYQGDDGQRTLQVSPSRHLAVSDPGNDVFMRIKNGNGYFTTTYAAGNTGTGVVDAGNVTDPAAWNSLATNQKNLSVKFYVDSTATPPVTYYDLVDTNATTSLLTNAAPVVPTLPIDPLTTPLRVYKDGQPIVFSGLTVTPPTPADYGINVTVTGAPGDGDSFTLAPSTSQSLFKTLATLIGKLEAGPGTAADRAKLATDVGSALTNLGQSEENILRVRAEIGSRGNEVDSLASANTDLDLQYQQTLSNLQDLDWAKALSDITRKQTDLEAAQKSFVSTSKLSLFNYI